VQQGGKTGHHTPGPGAAGVTDMRLRRGDDGPSGPEGKALQKPDALSVVTLFSGHPVCVIETLSRPGCAALGGRRWLAATEGEGDGSPAYWQRAHTAFFGCECQRLGREFTPSAPVASETFAVVYRGGTL